MNKEEPQTGKSKKRRRRMSRGRHSNEGFDLQIQINGQSAAIHEAEGTSHDNDGTELAAESHQKVRAHFALLNPSNLEKEIKEK